MLNKAITVGDIEVRSAIALAPMAGVADVPFRRLAWDLGAGYMVSEMVSSRDHLWDTDKNRMRRVALSGVFPNVIQIAGCDPKVLSESAKKVVDEGADIVDINFGCPAKKVCKKSAGSALLDDTALIGVIVEAVSNAVPVPVTIKTRTGITPDDQVGIEAAKIAQESGAQMIVIHSRSRSCRFKGAVDHRKVAELRSSLSIPFLVNGDICCEQSAKTALKKSLADGVTQNDNVTIYENSPVIDLEDAGSHDGQKVWKAKTSLGSISSPKVILAVNGIVERFGFFQNRLMTIFTYSSLTRELTSDESSMLGGSKEWGLTSADAMGSSVRRISGIGGNRILVRNRWSYNPSMEASDSFMSSAANSHNESFKARFPMLDKVSMEYSWGGRLCLSLNNVFAQGEVDEGVYSACCQNGLGTAKGTAIGIITAEKITGTINSLVPDFVDEEAPKKLMPKPLMWFGVNSYMRWKELMAGKEK